MGPVVNVGQLFNFMFPNNEPIKDLHKLRKARLCSRRVKLYGRRQSMEQTSSGSVRGRTLLPDAVLRLCFDACSVTINALK